MLEITYKKIEDIKPYKHNAKKHPEEQIAQICKSIEEFGMNDPIAIDENGIIIEGHGRLLAVKKMIKDGTYHDETIPCIILDSLTDQQKKAYILAHNKLTMNSDFDIDILNEELSRITEFNMGDFGFIDDATDDDALPASSNDNLVQSLPDSRILVCSLSVFGKDSEIFIESKLPQDIADKLVTNLFKLDPSDIAKKLQGALNDL